jgi:hypothetical protein
LRVVEAGRNFAAAGQEVVIFVVSWDGLNLNPHPLKAEGAALKSSANAEILGLALGLEGGGFGGDVDFDAVAAGAFGGVEGFVGLGDESGEGGGAFAAEAGDAEAGGKRDALVAEFEFAGGPFFTEAVDGDFDVAFFDVGDDEEEFVAAHAAANVGGACVAFEDFGEAFEDDVAGVVTVAVVDFLEGVEIGLDDPHGKAVAGGAAELAVGPVFDGAAIREIGHRIGVREGFEETIFCVDFAMEINGAATNADSREQLARIEGLGEVIVGAGSEAFYHVVFFGFCAEHDDIGVFALLFSADLLQEFKAGKIGQHPVGHDDGGAMAAEKLNGFLAILGEEERVAGRFQRVLHELAGDSGIVNDQDLAAWQRLLHEFPMSA